MAAHSNAIMIRAVLRVVPRDIEKCDKRLAVRISIITHFYGNKLKTFPCFLAICFQTNFYKHIEADYLKNFYLKIRYRIGESDKFFFPT